MHAQKNHDHLHETRDQCHETMIDVQRQNHAAMFLVDCYIRTSRESLVSIPDPSHI